MQNIKKIYFINDYNFLYKMKFLDRVFTKKKLYIKKTTKIFMKRKLLKVINEIYNTYSTKINYYE